MKQKKSSKVSFHDYLLRMCEIGKTHKIDDESMIKHIINGVPDDLSNKQMLFGAASLKEFRVKYFAYEKFKSEFAVKTNTNMKKDGKSETKTSGEKGFVKKKDDRNYFLCGETGHIAPKCPTKESGMKCFNCDEFGHRATDCPSKKTVEKTTEKKSDGDERGWH